MKAKQTVWADCRDSSGVGRQLTPGKVYRVHEIKKHGSDNWVLIKNDLGDRGEYNAGRFEVRMAQ